MRTALALPHWLPIPTQAEPRQILENSGFKFRTHPRAIEILDP